MGHVIEFCMAARKCLLEVFTIFLLLQVICSTDNDHALFRNFISNYKKTYTDEIEEYWNRFLIFKNNLRATKEMTKSYPNDTAVYGINKFSDLTQEEFERKYLGGLWPMQTHRPGGVKTLKPLKRTYRPDKVDWRMKKVVTPVKNQGSCGACWAFSVVEVIESMYSITTGKPVPELAVQEVIDCSTGSGCEGGDTCSALNWMISENKTIQYEKDYPLLDKTGTCRLTNTTTSGVNVMGSSCERFVQNEDKMLDLLSTVGPIAVTVDASTWKNYVSGVIKFHCPAINNHAVQIVGYDLTGDVPYYIVRNSWGEDFGDNGYLYIKIGDNLCGISERVSTATIQT